METSGLIAQRDRVLSVAVVTIGPDGEQTGEFSTLLDPGCDPGPVEVHGLTVERLQGAPAFGQVAGQLGAMLQDRVLVAHNAQFDYDFLAYEFARARMWLPVSQRLCTLALNRQVDPPTDDMKLGTLAAHPGATVPAPHRPGDSAGILAKPLTDRRVLVLGGVHRDAAAARTRVVELGGSAAVNLSAGVTDVVLLAGGEDDRRMSRITALELALHDAGWLTSPTVTDPAAVAVRPKEPYVMPRGGVIDLPAPSGGPAPEWYVTASWAPRTDCEIDVVAFILDEDEQVTFDEDLIFHGAPESPAGTVRLLTGGPAEQTIALDLASLPPATRKVVVAAAIDGATTFGTVGAIQISAAPGNSGSPLTRATLDAATTERTMLLATSPGRRLGC
ncbi:TerD family protein [Streptomyces sp. NPDC087844]|uniref:TerD family protein n=1 Tax=Streptomyces sp. NPDC087844 TaxID=3365805 RepID=UPI0038244F21